VAELRADAAALPRVWRALGAAPPPLTIVVLPYLYEPVWSGDLLLLPEVGFPIAQATREHAAAATLAQLWLRSARPEHLALLWQGASEIGQRDAHYLPVQPSGRSPDPLGRWLEVTPAVARPVADMRLSLNSWVALEPDPPDERDLFLDLYRHDPNWAAVGPAILALHDWAAAVGGEKALRLAGTTWQASAATDMSGFFKQLARRRGIAVPQR
jgi:hypothetical protein